MLKVLNKAQVVQAGGRYSADAPIVRRPDPAPKTPDHSVEIQRALAAIEKLCADLCRLQAEQGAGLVAAIERSSATGSAAAQSSTQALVKLLRNTLDQRRQATIEFPASKPESQKSVKFTVLQRDDKNRVVEFVAEESSVEEEPKIVIENQH